MLKQQFIEKKLKMLDDKIMHWLGLPFPEAEVQKFLQSSLSECWDMAGEEIRQKINKSDITLWEPEDRAYILEVISKK